MDSEQNVTVLLRLAENLTLYPSGYESDSDASSSFTSAYSSSPDSYKKRDGDDSSYLSGSANEMSWKTSCQTVHAEFDKNTSIYDYYVQFTYPPPGALQDLSRILTRKSFLQTSDFQLSSEKTIIQSDLELTSFFNSSLDSTESFVDSSDAFSDDMFSEDELGPLDLSFKPSNTSTPEKDSSLSNSPGSGKICYLRPAKRKLDFSIEIEKQPQIKKLCKESILLNSNKNQPHCEYCKKNGEPEMIYTHHTLKDKKGRTLCPVLRLIECIICKADGDEAHPVQLCPRRRRRLDLHFINDTMLNVQNRLRVFKI